MCRKCLGCAELVVGWDCLQRHSSVKDVLEQLSSELPATSKREPVHLPAEEPSPPPLARYDKPAMTYHRETTVIHNLGGHEACLSQEQGPPPTFPVARGGEVAKITVKVDKNSESTLLPILDDLPRKKQKEGAPDKTCVMTYIHALLHILETSRSHLKPHPLHPHGDWKVGACIC